MKYDVIIIGSGLGGLLCAAGLAEFGRSVLVLERQIQPGGCMQSYRRQGKMSFDTGLHYVGGLTEGHRIYEVFSRLGLMELPWHRMDDSGFDLITIDGKTYPIASGYENFVDTLSEYFPKERDGLRKYTEMLQNVERQPFTAKALLPIYGTSAYSYLCETFSDPLLINILAGSSIKMELRKETLSLFTFAHGNSSYISSSWRLKGDGNMLVDKLVSRLHHFGGELICNAEAEKLVENELRMQFKPEFLNRLDEIVFFKPLQKEDVRKIIDLQMADLNRRLEERQITVRLEEDAKDKILEESYDPVFGARPLKRYLQKKVETLLAKKILGGQVHLGEEIRFNKEDLQ